MKGSAFPSKCNIYPYSNSLNKRFNSKGKNLNIKIKELWVLVKNGRIYPKVTCSTYVVSLMFFLLFTFLGYFQWI